MTAIVTTKNAAHWYGQVIGVNDLEVEVQPGITGLLGPNGAGKSTFIKLITGQLRPSHGTVRVLGVDPFANHWLYRRLGVCPEHDALYNDMTGAEFVAFTMQLHGCGRTEARERARTALERVGLADTMNRRAGGYSKGMRQRLKIAQAIAHEPELMILDEPLTGLDPVMRVRMLELFKEMTDRGVHLIVSSHVLHEIEALTQTILLIHRGRVLAHGAVAEIKKLFDRRPGRMLLRAREARRLAQELLRLPDVKSVRLVEETDTLIVEATHLETLERRLPGIIASERPGIESMEALDADLESVFDYLVD